MTKSTSQPKDYILQSFNAFDPDIAKNPQNVLKHLISHIQKEIVDDQISFDTNNQVFSAKHEETSSARATQTNFAISVGMSASFAIFSASAQVDSSQDQYQTATAFNSSSKAKIDYGSLSFKKPDTILKYLDESLVAELNNIQNLTDAKIFTKKYGTHLITGVYLGGLIFINTQAATTTYEDKSVLATSVAAGYAGGTVSVGAFAKTNQEVQNKNASSNLKQTILAIGGDSALAASITNSSNAEAFTEWAKSCNENSVYGISSSIEYWELTNSSILQKYINLVMLEQSINRPTFFSNHIAIKAYSENSVTAVANNDYKIISGGASVTQHSSSFLISSTPNLDNNKNITGWNARSHDLCIAANPATDYLTAYAIAVYDPGDLLQICIESANGTNVKGGYDMATAKIHSAHTLTGGGCDFQVNSGDCNKFIMSSYPDDEHSWTGDGWDYNAAATNVVLTVCAIGIYNPNITMHSSRVQLPLHNIQYGNAKSTSNSPICGGGTKVEIPNINTYGGNLLQQSYPSASNEWSEYNKDLNSQVTFSNVTAYAISITAKLKLDV